MIPNRKTTPFSFPAEAKRYFLLFSLFTSGFIALVLEVCWIKRSTLTFGSTLPAVSTVVAVFFSGLALGSYFFGQRCVRTRYPIRLYALLECCVGLFGALTPLLFSISDTLYGITYPLLDQNPLIFNIIRVFLIAVILLVPTFCMGGSLPLMVRYCTAEMECNSQNRQQRETPHAEIQMPATPLKKHTLPVKLIPTGKESTDNKISRRRNTGGTILFSIGFLYAINTVGATLGCLFCGFFLVPSIGIAPSIYCSAFVSCCIGGALFLINYNQSEPAVEKTYRISSAQKRENAEIIGLGPLSPGTTVKLLKTLFFCTGCISLGNEMIWTRYLSLIIHNTVYTYTITLSVILSGIVIGSALVSTFPRLFQKSIGLNFGMVHCATGIAMISLPHIPHTFWYPVLNSHDTWTIVRLCCTVLFIPSLLNGISFPLAVRMAVKRHRDTGAATGIMSAFNIFGGVCGSLLFAFLLLPHTGLHTSIILSSGASVGIGLAGILLLFHTARPMAIRGIALTAITVWTGLAFFNRELLPARFLAGDNQLLYYQEGLQSFIAVVKDRYNKITLEIDRLWQGSTATTHQIMAAHVPMVLHKNPRNVCVIGLGAGQTARQFLSWDIHSLIIVDIEKTLPGIVERYFQGSWLSDTRITCIVDDGRSYLRHTSTTFDIISIEVGQLFRPQCAPFYTREMYQSVKKRLSPEGLACQFVPLTMVGRSQFKRIIRTFLDVFPGSILWYNESELLLIGSSGNHPSITRRHFEQCIADSAINALFSFSYWGGIRNQVKRPEIFAAGFLCGPKRLQTLTTGCQVYTDDKPLLEYDAARRRGNNSDTLMALVQLLSRNLDSLDIILPQESEDTLFHRSRIVRQQNLRNNIALEYFKGYMQTREEPYLSRAYTFNPFNLGILLERGLRYARNGDFERAQDLFTAILDIDSTFSQAYNNLGLIHLERNNRPEAMKLYARAILYDSCNVNAYLNLGQAWIRENNLREAFNCFNKAHSIEPGNTDAAAMVELLKKRGIR